MVVQSLSHLLRGALRPSLYCGLLLSLAFSARAGAEDLLDIYRLALDNDPVYKQAIAQHQAALEARPQTRAQLLPSFSASANTTDNDWNYAYGSTSSSTFTLPSGERAYNSHGYDFTLTQPIYHQSYIDQYKQAGKQIRQSFAQLGAAELDLIVRASQAYFNVLAAEDTLQFAESEKKADEQQLEQTKQQFKVGLIAITDVHEAQASYDLSVAQVIQARNQVANAREALAQITGRYHADLRPLGDQVPLAVPAPRNIDQWTQLALDRSPALTASRYAAEAAKEQVAVQRAQHYPTVDLIVNSSNQVQKGSNFGLSSTVNGTAVELQVNVPIFAGGAVASRTRQAHDQFIQAQQAEEQQRRTTIDQTRSSYLNVESNISLIKAYNQAIISNTSRLEATKAGLEVGTRTTVDVLNARRDLFRARTDYAQARYNYVVSRLQLKQAAGTLSPEDIQEINTWLQGTGPAVGGGPTAPVPPPATGKD